MSDAENPRCAAALEYARRGWPVLPLHTPHPDGSCSCGQGDCQSPGKHPRTTHGVKDATTDETTICRWWAEWPDANVGIATGKASGLVVLDVDPRHGGDESLAELKRREGMLPETVEALTGGGGRHLFFAYPEGGLRTRTSVVSGLDIRSDGAFVVAAPSLHAKGSRYEWELSSCPDDVSPGAMPEWLIALAGPPGRNGDQPVGADASDIPEGRRNATLASLAGSMRRRGMTEDAIRAALRTENASRCRPPLPEAEVDRIAASVASYPPDPLASVASRPGITVTNRQDRELLDQARAALYEADRSLLYRDPGRLMRVEGAGLRMITGGDVHNRLAAAANWTKETKDGERAAPVPRRLIEPLLEAPGPPIPLVRQVISIPAFVGEDLTFVTRPGLDGNTLFVGEPLEIRPVSEEPTAEELQAATAVLDSWLSEFPFTDTASRAGAFAFLFTLLMRPAIHGRVPMFGIEASTTGTGKTTLAEIICIAAHGVPPISNSWTRDGEEMGKRAASWALGAHAVVLLDDLARITGDPSHVLSSLITTGAIQVRAMRELSTTGGRWDGVLAYTGNNVRLSEEMPRKICRIRLLSPETPWTRPFRRPDIHAWTLEHRAEILHAAGIVVAAWKAIGRPLGPRTRPSFHEWATTIGGILGCVRHELQAAFLDPRDVAEMMDFGEGVDDLRGLIDAWVAVGRAPRTAAELVAIAEDVGVLEDVLGDGNPRSRASRLGRYLKGQRDKVVGGHRLVGTRDATAKVMRWSLVPVSDDSGVPS